MSEDKLPKDKECIRRKHSGFQNQEYVANQSYFDLGRAGYAMKTIMVDQDGKVIDIQKLLSDLKEALKK